MRRGYRPSDEKEFRGPGLEKLRCAADDLCCLLGRGYPLEGAATFVGNHYLLSERQRLALSRISASPKNAAARKAKEVPLAALAGRTVNVDGFNQIITLEVALSGAPVFRCRDGTFRDLAGLRGTYRLIEQTGPAIRLLLAELQTLGAARADFWLDAPVSNSGRLKTRIAETAEELGFPVGIEVTDAVDAKLYALPNAATSDSVILDRGVSWVNPAAALLPKIPGAWSVDTEE